ncbi:MULTISPECIES: phosphonate metabolism protein/1,5-bisphosphokinase (PRPP-forming) PhnN [Alphaproteobacteria]|uniref:Ribose 1,5-bisphosphate phosphokinase PhnN n=2 Tax=Alphaproteobacteria TaxID=28211 RepID=A0A512HIV5_9HYPH|nr:MULTISPECIES: phosphonate metabolism protein/1,5-bisphosphokinase (PRPP-forming) PhnN [Alphaproteobacteria]GEO85375.1 ribose 1,5-bisphosphate phosphokinase PhnN [Ciceribacter naphthalenivorans]GLR21014.1 ribose 1,5-bisphosphate phosphokinase PhnN [Ciceribacter naphthalenivorans]GLT03870.1 ribose 1,5-bisphosphate phosphokinase PhnN [Sphingomonas psychrolutea]
MNSHSGIVRDKVSTGTMVAVVGPSGAGKDSLLAIAMAHFAGRPDVHFVQRVITRPEDAGGEKHICVSSPEFEAMRAQGAFAVDWDAHGLRYGIPASVHEKLALGHMVIANGSRSALPRWAQAFSPLLIINVTASPEVLAGRLVARGRETRDEILHRLNRSSLTIEGNYDVVTIDNSGVLAEAGAKLISILERVLAGRSQAET